MRPPCRIQPGGSVDKLVEEVDVLPTVLDLLGVRAPDGVQGVNLLTDRKKQAVFAEFPTIKMVRTLEWKLVHYPGAKHCELYDLMTSPGGLAHSLTGPETGTCERSVRKG
jgi:arylsulfatase A-like enzyme